jgi:hypothetical protein
VSLAETPGWLASLCRLAGSAQFGKKPHLGLVGNAGSTSTVWGSRGNAAIATNGRSNPGLLVNLYKLAEFAQFGKKPHLGLVGNASTTGTVWGSWGMPAAPAPPAPNEADRNRPSGSARRDGRCRAAWPARRQPADHNARCRNSPHRVGAAAAGGLGG